MPFNSTSDFLYIPISIAILLAVWLILQIHSKSMANQLVQLLKRQPASHKLIDGHVNHCNIALHKQSVLIEQSPIAKKLGFPSDCEIVKILISNSSQTQIRSFSRNSTPIIELKNVVHMHASIEAHVMPLSNVKLNQETGKCAILKAKNKCTNSAFSSEFGKAAIKEFTRFQFSLPECLRNDKQISKGKSLSIVCSLDSVRSIRNIPLLSLRSKSKNYGGKIDLQFNNATHIKLPHAYEVGIANADKVHSVIQNGLKVSYIAKSNSRNTSKPIVLLDTHKSKLKLNSKYSLNLSKSGKKSFTHHIGVDCNFIKLSKQKLGCMNIGDGIELSTSNIDYNSIPLAKRLKFKCHFSTSITHKHGAYYPISACYSSQLIHGNNYSMTSRQLVNQYANLKADKYKNSHSSTSSAIILCPNKLLVSSIPILSNGMPNGSKSKICSINGTGKESYSSKTHGNATMLLNINSYPQSLNIYKVVNSLKPSKIPNSIISTISNSIKSDHHINHISDQNEISIKGISIPPKAYYINKAYQIDSGVSLGKRKMQSLYKELSNPNEFKNAQSLSAFYSNNHLTLNTVGWISIDGVKEREQKKQLALRNIFGVSINCMNNNIGLHLQSNQLAVGVTHKTRYQMHGMTKLCDRQHQLNITKIKANSLISIYHTLKNYSKHQINQSLNTKFTQRISLFTGNETMKTNSRMLKGINISPSYGHKKTITISSLNVGKHLYIENAQLIANAKAQSVARQPDNLKRASKCLVNLQRDIYLNYFNSKKVGSQFELAKRRLILQTSTCGLTNSTVDVALESKCTKLSINTSSPKQYMGPSYTQHSLIDDIKPTQMQFSIPESNIMSLSLPSHLEERNSNNAKRQLCSYIQINIDSYLHSHIPSINLNKDYDSNRMNSPSVSDKANMEEHSIDTIKYDDIAHNKAYRLMRSCSTNLIGKRRRVTSLHEKSRNFKQKSSLSIVSKCSLSNKRRHINISMNPPKSFKLTRTVNVNYIEKTESLEDAKKPKSSNSSATKLQRNVKEKKLIIGHIITIDIVPNTLPENSVDIDTLVENNKRRDNLDLGNENKEDAVDVIESPWGNAPLPTLCNKKKAKEKGKSNLGNYKDKNNKGNMGSARQLLESPPKKQLPNTSRLLSPTQSSQIKMVNREKETKIVRKDKATKSNQISINEDLGETRTLGSMKKTKEIYISLANSKVLKSLASPLNNNKHQSIFNSPPALYGSEYPKIKQVTHLTGDSQDMCLNPDLNTNSRNKTTKKQNKPRNIISAMEDYKGDPENKGNIIFSGDSKINLDLIGAPIPDISTLTRPIILRSNSCSHLYDPKHSDGKKRSNSVTKSAFVTDTNYKPRTAIPDMKLKTKEYMQSLLTDSASKSPNLRVPSRYLDYNKKKEKQKKKVKTPSTARALLEALISPSLNGPKRAASAILDIAFCHLADMLKVGNLNEIPEEIRPISNYEAENDKVDMALSHELNDMFKLFGGLPVPLKKISKSFYKFGNVKIHMNESDGNLIVRVGGGYVTLADFLKTFLPLEVARIQNSNVYKHYMLKMQRINNALNQIAQGADSKFIASVKDQK